MNVGNLAATLSLNISNFTKSVNQALKEVRGLGKNLENNVGGNTQRSINNTTKSVNALGGSFKDLDRIVSGILISQLFYGTVTQIKQATASVIEFKNEMEKAQIAMEYFLGSTDRARGFIMNMKDFAAVTAFSTEQALVLSRRLMGAQFKPEQIRTVMSILNDANAATGATAEQMDRIVLALTQIKTNGKLAGQEVRQLAEAGIPIYNLLREELGLTQKQMQEGFANLAIDGDAAVMAVLNGLNKRYQGAAERIADTLPGLVGTIKDDMLFLSEEVFEAPYSAMREFLRRWRDGLEDARDVMTEKGMGGVFEHFVPPELQQSMRNFIGSLKSLWGSIKMVYATLKPVATMLGGALLKALGQIMPIIASVVRTVVQLSAAVANANPWVQALIAAIMGLMVAGAAAKALMFLWSVTRMGVLCTVVAQAVTILAKSIQFLFLVLSRNPITGMVILLSGALLYLALSSKTVSQWLDHLSAKLGNLSGLNMSDILQPEDGKSMDEWTKSFNESLEQMNAEMKALGVNAVGAGKKIKDKFAASFDELYQVPDQLDDIGIGMQDLGNMPDFPALPVTALPGLAMPGLDKDGFDVPKVPPVAGRTPGDGGGPRGGGGPPIQPPNMAPVIEAIDTINERIGRMRQQMQPAFLAVSEGVELAGQSIVRMQPAFATVTEGITEVGDALVQTTGEVVSFSEETTQTTEGWANTNKRTFSQWVTETLTGFGLWGSRGTSLFGGWSLETVGGFTSWGADALGAMGTGLANMGNSIGAWAVGTGEIVSGWIESGITGIGGWATSTGQSIAIWGITSWEAISDWSVQTRTAVTDWISETSTALVDWAVNTGTNFAVWIETSLQNLGQWAIDTGKNFGIWVATTSQNVYEWGINTGANIASWVNNTAQSIGNWVTGTAADVATWVTGTSSNVASWVTGTSSAFVSWANASASAVSEWANSSWDVMENWLSGTANSIASWASSTIDSIVSWVQAAWSNIQGLAAAVGASLSGSFKSVKNTITNTYKGVAQVVKDNQKQIAAAAIVGGVTALGIAATIATGGAAAPALIAGLAAGGITSGILTNANPSIPQYATGTIVDYDHIARLGEGGKREAVIPLENSTYMKPFSAAVANDLLEMLSEGGGGFSQREADHRPILYVGTLIADQSGLKELERKLEIIRVSEGQRKGEQS